MLRKAVWAPVLISLAILGCGDSTRMAEDGSDNQSGVETFDEPGLPGAIESPVSTATTTIAAGNSLAPSTATGAGVVKSAISKGGKQPNSIQEMGKAAAAAGNGRFVADHGPQDETAEAPPESLKAPIHYAWRVGSRYVCKFKFTAEVGNERFSESGSVIYRPLDAAREDKENRAPRASGTAFAITDNGILATCAHVIRGATHIEARLGKQSFPASVIAYDPRHDLALLRIAGKPPALPLGSSKRVEAGQDIRAIGYPLATVLGETLKVTRGNVAGFVPREGSRWMQIDAAVNPGNSGGPLVDPQGNVLGVVSAKLDGQQVDRVGFAIPVEGVRQLAADHRVQLSAQAATEELDGPALFRRVSPSVVFLEVQLGPGGVGGDPVRLVAFEGEATDESSTANRPIREKGTMVVDEYGLVRSYDSDSNATVFFRSLGMIGVERLPVDGEKKWEYSRSLVLMRRQAQPAEESDAERLLGRGPLMPRFDPYHRGYDPYYRAPGFGYVPPPAIGISPPYGPRPRLRQPMPGYDRYPEFEQGPPSPVGPRQAAPRKVEEKLVSQSAEESTECMIEEQTDEHATFRKTFRLRTTEKDSDGIEIEIEGKGRVVWDKHAGMPRSGNLALTAEFRHGAETRRVPLTFTYTQEVVEPRKPRAKALDKAAADEEDIFAE